MKLKRRTKASLSTTIPTQTPSSVSGQKTTTKSIAAKKKKPQP